MSGGPTLLVDVGSTVVKVCVHDQTHGFHQAETIARRADLAPGEQIRALIDRRRARADIPGLRACSSANGQVKVGVLGLSRRHSLAAAVRAAVVSGGDVLYARLLGDRSRPPAPPVDLLVVAGGVDGADHRHLRDALGRTPLENHPHEVLVWAGANTPDIVAALPVHHVVANVVDQHLRPSTQGLADIIHHRQVSDLVDRKGLRALADLTDTPIRSTPAVVALAAERLTTGRVLSTVAAPFLIVDVGGTTTDVLYRTELRARHAARTPPGESIVQQVFTDLGVAGSRPGLLQRLATDPDLLEMTAAIAPERSRALHHDLCEGAVASLAPPVAFLACLFLALRRLTDPAGPHMLQPGRATSVVITGGAWKQTPQQAIRRVIGAACGTPQAHFNVHLDRAYALWAHGLLALPPNARPAAQPRPGRNRRTASASGSRTE